MSSVQAIRVLGVLGALDPYRHKVHLGEVSLSRDSGAMSEAKPLHEAGQQGTLCHACYSYGPVSRDISDSAFAGFQIPDFACRIQDSGFCTRSYCKNTV